MELTEAVGVEPELKATPLREEQRGCREARACHARLTPAARVEIRH